MEVLALCGILQSMFKIFLRAYEKCHSVGFLGSFSLEVNPGESEPLLSCDSCWEPTGLLITQKQITRTVKNPDAPSHWERNLCFPSDSKDDVKKRL